jgi:hypothetical protein
VSTWRRVGIHPPFVEIGEHHKNINSIMVLRKNAQPAMPLRPARADKR